VTLTVIGLCALAYVAQLTVPGFTGQWAFFAVLGADEPWRFLTAAFLHSPSGFMHIVLNMVALWAVGPYLETSLGRARYITLYLLSALGGSTAMVVWADLSGAWFTAVVGASGAVFGLFGAVLVVLRRTGRSARGIIAVVALNTVIGFLVPGIAWQAHLGGLVVGALLGTAYAYAPRHRRRTVSITASVTAGVVLVLVAVGVYASVGLI